MKKTNPTNNYQLTTAEYIATLLSSVIGISILYLPNTAVEAAHQDGWIATALGCIYPLYVIWIASFIIKRHPDTGIIDLSKKYLGRVLGSILSFLFMIQFPYYAIAVLSAANSFLKVYSVWFMSNNQITLIFVFLVLYLTLKGLKVLARINTISVYIIFALMLTTSTAFIYGSLLNVQPVFQNSVGKIAEGTLNTIFSYSIMETMLIIHPYVKDKKKLIKGALIATAIITFFYTWSVFTSTVYLGPDIVTKALWPVNFVTESIQIPAINNFRFVLLILWPIIIFKTIATEHYLTAEVMSKIFSTNTKIWCIVFAPVIVLGSMYFSNEVERRSFFSTYTPWVTLYSVLFVTFMAVVTVLKSKSPKKGVKESRYAKKI